MDLFKRNVTIISANIQKIIERTTVIKRLLRQTESQEDADICQHLHQIQRSTIQLAQGTSRNLKHLNEFNLKR